MTLFRAQDLLLDGLVAGLAGVEEALDFIIEA